MFSESYTFYKQFFVSFPMQQTVTKLMLLSNTTVKEMNAKSC